MEKNLKEVFGEIVKASRDTGLTIASNYKNKLEMPKLPDEEQTAFLNLIDTLSDEQFIQLQKGLKYSIELSLFKLISGIEGGIGQYTFSLLISDKKDEVLLVGDGVDNDLSIAYWEWVSES